jgi:thiamine biosynthesis lipoprotein
MGTWAHVVVVGGPTGALGRARSRIEQLEGRWSRFRPDSEVSRLNRAGGRPLVVSADTVTLVSRALSGRRATGGLFDPTLLGPLVEAGYDRSFELVARRSPAAGGRRPAEAGGRGCSGRSAVAVDERVGTVALPSGTGFDAGGIGKGLAADLVVADLLAHGATGACVNLGGDLRAEGDGPWTVDVADPFDGRRRPVARLSFDAGGVATSSCLRRTWWHDGTARHHLIDPATGRPSGTDVAAVTVLTGDAWRAEVLATAALLAGTDRALDVLAAAGATGLVVDGGGRTRLAPDLGPFLSGP